ncbi:PrgI family protein, partial [Candidatus Dojkabacteria bacterium]|nr:PrgI family protein [Candidatus Dojkabacteria bacterium]
MRQHPIPQNVLDVEFKLFTKFTLKEFTYIAIGTTIGGVFLYFTSKGSIPGIIGIPIFIISSGIGTFFGLVPINDQPADKFIINYFNAIYRPTQMVWLNEQLKEQRAKPIVIKQEEEKGKIFGSTKVAPPKLQIYQEEPGDDILNTDTKDSTSKKEDEALVQDEENLRLVVPKPTDDTDNEIRINKENISKYQFDVKSVDRLPGNINIWLVNQDNIPVPNVNTYLKNKDDKIIYANKTGPNGYFLTS